MRLFLIMAAALAAWSCERAPNDAPAAQRAVVARACVDGKLTRFGLKYDRIGCACAANVLQAQLSPAAMTALENYARGRQDGYAGALPTLPAEERVLFNTTRIHDGSPLAKVAADCR
ncbi:hypothetical protein [Caulobacter hibisci]|uniref:Lipoprotein n=1 Tax=Caulobacter hibisci TaxID=2035993 RepID=A0ABS0SSC3_9CAUL|nr:hypothetical protein [Caulobacter hibisci]MBI1682540.1 hypothetical protein [Caulobacter hibisci]